MFLPKPKIVSYTGGKLFFQPEKPVDMEISAGQAYEKGTIAVIRSELEGILGQQGGISIVITWHSGLVDAPHVAEQAYMLEVSPREVTIKANTAIGALYAVQTFRQLQDQSGARPTVLIHDWPDVEIRIAGRPLLCAETRRSALDWGDGIDAFISRWKHEIDFALQYRFNAFYAWGFSWNPEAFPGFGRCFRELNAYARARGVRLTFGGLGIGTHKAGYERILADADDLSVGLGYSVPQTWPCSRVDHHQKEGVYCGTCRSDAEIRAQKIKDLAAFVKAVEPGLLYIHHEDLNLIEETQQEFWDCRCDQCRKKWPDNRMEALNGGAGAIADTMNAYSEALDSVPESASGYLASRDCIIMVASPGYGDYSETDAQWRRITELWKNVVRQLVHQEQFLFSIREQYRGEDGRLRIPDFADELRSLGFKCGIKASMVGGADLYYNNAPFTAAPELFGVCSGARGVFCFTGILFQRPLMVFTSECLWNLTPDPEGCVRPVPPTREECLELLATFAFIGRASIPERYADPAGWLAQACQMLYGKKAGEKMFAYQLLRSPGGRYPLSILYYETHMRRKLFRIMDNPATNHAQEKVYWSETREVTRQGRELVVSALKVIGQELTPFLVQELEHQKKCLEIGEAFAATTEAFFADDRKEYLVRLEKYESLAKQFPQNFIAPNEGDAELYLGYAGEFKKRLDTMK